LLLSCFNFADKKELEKIVEEIAKKASKDIEFVKEKLGSI